jgi:hypothetical protein
VSVCVPAQNVCPRCVSLDGCGTPSCPSSSPSPWSPPSRP